MLHVRNTDLYRYLQIPTLKEEIKRLAGKHEAPDSQLQLLDSQISTAKKEIKRFSCEHEAPCSPASLA